MEGCMGRLKEGKGRGNLWNYTIILKNMKGINFKNEDTNYQSYGIQ